MTDYYDDLALQLVPLGGHVSVVKLRKDIAQTVRDVVKLACQQQLQKNFPELEERRKELEGSRKTYENMRFAEAAKLKDTENEMDSRFKSEELYLRKISDAINERMTRLLVREAAMKELVIAVDDYEAWQNGDGDTDEIGERYHALRAAIADYKRKTQHEDNLQVSGSH